MNENLKYALRKCDTDLEGALHRFFHNEGLYESFLLDFLKDTTIEELDGAISNGLWDDAFTAAHALKGLAGNMGFIPLFHAAGEMVILIRSGKVNDLPESSKKMRQCYNALINAIKRNCEKQQISKAE